MAKKLAQFHYEGDELEDQLRRLQNKGEARGLDDWTIRWLLAAEVKIATLQALQELVLEGTLVVGPPAGKRNGPMAPLGSKLYHASHLPAKGTRAKPC